MYPTISVSIKEKTIDMEEHLQNILTTLPLVVTEFTPDTTAGRVLQSSIERYHKTSDEVET
jgi:hypothetical protein